MGRAEIAAYESEVDKLCSKWVVDIAKELKSFNDKIKKLSLGLGTNISKVKVPQGLSEKEFNEIPDRINKILRDDSDRIRDVIEIKFTVNLDVKKKTIEINGYSSKGK